MSTSVAFKTFGVQGRPPKNMSSKFMHMWRGLKANNASVAQSYKPMHQFTRRPWTDAEYGRQQVIFFELIVL